MFVGFAGVFILAYFNMFWLVASGIVHICKKKKAAK